MTTQITNLLFQATGANAATPRSPSPERLADSARDNGAFGATLSREMAARQQRPQPSVQPSAPQQPKPPQQQAKPNSADKPANREPVREQAGTAGAKEAGSEPGANTAKVADGKEEAGPDTTAAAAEAAAAAAAPVTDMLVFMASLTRPSSTPGDPAAGADELPELETMSAATVAADDSGAGVQRAPGDPNAAQALPEGQQDAPQFQAQLRETRQQVVPAAEEAPAPLVQLQAQAARMADAVGNPAAVPGDRIPARVGTQAWDNQISQRIVYMVGKEQAATLTLNPPDLGPVQIVLNVSNDQASVAFSSEQLEVRQALENALPRLREMMSESGIALGNATVDAGAAGRQQQEGERRPPGGAGANGNLADNDHAAEPAVNETAPRTRSVALGERGMVDLFA